MKKEDVALAIAKRFIRENKTYNKKTNCWNWNFAPNGKGYSQILILRKMVRVHRVSYVLFKGELKEGYVIDHLCRNRRCMNPDHLEQVKQRENLERGVGTMIKVNREKTHCKNGHEYTKENTIIQDHGNYIGRSCRKCSREYYHLKKLNGQKHKRNRANRSSRNCQCKKVLTKSSTT